MSLISYLTRIHFAERVLEDALGTEIARLNAARPLILIDADGSDGDGAALLEDALPASCTPVWAGDIGITCTAGQAGKITEASTRRAPREAGCDMIVAFGGAAALSFGRRLAGGNRSRLPLIAVPTTTSDMGLSSGVAPARPAGAHLAVPDAILCDPTLTYGLCPRRTAAYGFDALTHCIEAFLAPGFNPPADGIALEGIHRAARYLEDAVRDGRQAEPRREVMAAALNGALAAQKGLGGAEALTRAIEAESDEALPHGGLHACVLPQVMRFNAPAVGGRYARIATAMAAAGGADPIAALSDFAARIGLPDRIGHLGLGPDALRRVATGAAADPATQTNPRHVTQEDYLALLTRAI